MTAVECFVAELRRRGVEWMATLCGHGLDPLFHAATRAGFRLVDTRNEQTAAYAAEAYGRLTRRPGVCAVSSGIAHVNALTGLADAWFDGAPMLLISGSAAVRTAGLGHFQDMDQVALARPVSRFARVIDHPARTLEILDEAWQAALDGPAHVTFPMDVQRAEVGSEEMVRPVGARPLAALADSDWRSVLAAAERPLLVVGSAAYYAGAGQKLVDFAERYSIPLVIPIWDRGCVERPTPVFMGVLGAASGGPQLLQDADCILMAGAVNDYRTGYLQTNTPVGWIGRFDELEAPRNYMGWLSEAQRRRDSFRAEVRRRGEEQAQQGTHALHVIDAIAARMSDELILLLDGGSIGQWAHQLLADRYPGHWLTCGRSGVVGWGLGGAIGARMAYADRPIVLLSGDGAFTFNVAEIECAVRQRLPFVAIVADDLGWGITRTGHVRQYGEAIASSLGPIAFDHLAQALGARGVAAATPEAVGQELDNALSLPEVTVIHVPVVGGHPA
jgi:acetolactate synthase-1/2/3 large subunit